jgi:hypothetical protein
MVSYMASQLVKILSAPFRKLSRKKRDNVIKKSSETETRQELARETDKSETTTEKILDEQIPDTGLDAAQDVTFWKKRFFSQFEADPKSLNALADGLVILSEDISILGPINKIISNLGGSFSLKNDGKIVETLCNTLFFEGHISDMYGNKKREKYLEENGLLQFENAPFLRVCRSSFGLGVFATEDIKADDILFNEKPLIIGKKYDICHNCFSECKSAQYCSLECRLEVEKSYMRELNRRGVDLASYDNVDQIYVKTIGMALTRDCLIQDLPEFKTFYCAPLKHEKLYKVGKWYRIVSELNLLGDPHFDFSSYQYICSLQNTNAFGFGGGDALLKNTTLINHACAANCTYYRAQDCMQVRAVKDIKTGEELTIPYRSCCYNRREVLAEHYGFICQCTLCTRYSEPQTTERLRQLIAYLFY